MNLLIVTYLCVYIPKYNLFGLYNVAYMYAFGAEHLVLENQLYTILLITKDLDYLKLKLPELYIVLHITSVYVNVCFQVG